MHVDLILEADQTPRAIRELGLLAEGYGFRTLWAQNYARARDAFLSLVPLAEASSRIGIGVVVVSPYEMHPLKIANAILTLNEFCPGRAEIVLGAGGEWPGVMGVDYGKRVTGFREAVDIVKGAVSGKPLSYKGEVYRARGFIAHWHKSPPPLVWGGASGPKMLRAAARAADGVMMSDIALPMLARHLGLLREALAAEGRDPAAFRVSNFLAWHVKSDREKSLAESRRELMIRGWLEKDWLTPFLAPEDVDFVLKNTAPFLKAFRERHGNIEGVPPHITDALVEGLSCAGGPGDLDRHIERLRGFARGGLTEVALRLHDDPADSIHMLGKQVLPALRE